MCDAFRFRLSNVVAAANSLELTQRKTVIDGTMLVRTRIRWRQLCNRRHKATRDACLANETRLCLVPSVPPMRGLRDAKVEKVCRDEAFSFPSNWITKTADSEWRCQSRRALKRQPLYELFAKVAAKNFFILKKANERRRRRRGKNRTNENPFYIFVIIQMEIIKWRSVWILGKVVGRTVSLANDDCQCN